MSSIRVVNKKVEDGYPKDGYVYIGRPTALGNPFTHRSGTTARYKTDTREDAIQAYRDNWDKMMEDKRAANMFKLLVNKYNMQRKLILVCWCAPLPCHGEVIREKIEETLKRM